MQTEDTRQKRFCSHCGHSVSLSAKFCDDCGERLEIPAEVPQDATPQHLASPVQAEPPSDSPHGEGHGFFDSPIGGLMLVVGPLLGIVIIAFALNEGVSSASKNTESNVVTPTIQENGICAKGIREANRVSCKDDTLAFTMSEQFVKRQLVAPSTAKFCEFFSSEETTISYEGGAYTVNSCVDSQNGFGAILRKRFTAVLHKNPDGDSWHLDDLKFESRMSSFQ